jgi:hypothetical protein
MQRSTSSPPSPDVILASDPQHYIWLLLSYIATLLYSAIMSKSDRQRCAFVRLIGETYRTFSLAATVGMRVSSRMM